MKNRAMRKYRLLLVLLCFWLFVHACSPKIVVSDKIEVCREKPFALEKLAPLSLDNLTVIPALNGWVICDYDAKHERLLAIKPWTNKVAISTKDSAWKLDVIRDFDSDEFRILSLGFLSSKGTAIVYYESERRADPLRREEIDLKTKTVISIDKINT